MYRQMKILKTNILLLEGHSEPDLDETYCKDKLLLIIHKFPGPENEYKEIIVSPENSKIDVYYDDAKNLFITDFDEEEMVLDYPIQMIAVQKSKVTIYVGEYVMRFDTKNFPRKLSFPEFYLKNRFDLEEEGSRRKRRRQYTENRQSSSAECSVEYGMFTESNITNISTSPVSSIVSTSVESMNVGTQNEISQNIRKVNLIPTSKVDANKQKAVQVEWAKTKLATLFNRYRFPSKDEIVSVELLESSTTYPSTDGPISKMDEELRSTSALGEEDPIVVTENGLSLTVLSGSRRVQAIKAVGVKQIKVSRVKAEDEREYIMYHFFSKYFKSRKEPSTVEHIDFIRALFTYLEMEVDSLRDWTIHEIKDVFSSCFHENEKSYLLLEVCLQEDLADLIHTMEPFRTTMSVHCINEILRKFKYNPSETLRRISEMTPDTSESVFKKQLKTVEPDARLILKRKSIPDVDIEHLIGKFGNDNLFPRFVKSLDTRSNKKTLKTSCISKKFEVFRMKAKKPCTVAEPSLIISNSSACDGLITDSPDLTHEFLASKTNALVVLVACHTHSASNHTLFLREQQGFKDAFGMIHNHCSVSLLCKHEGRLLEGEELTDLFKESGLSRKSIMTVQELSMLIGKSICVLLEIHDNHLLKIACEILCSSELIGVLNKEKLLHAKPVLDEQFSQFSRKQKDVQFPKPPQIVRVE